VVHADDACDLESTYRVGYPKNRGQGKGVEHRRNQFQDPGGPFAARTQDAIAGRNRK
jgi:hypothetical protein